jgi:hypothetical protein
LIESLAEDLFAVLKVACKFDWALEAGTALVGLSEAVPIEEDACEATKFTSEAYEVISKVNEGV